MSTIPGKSDDRIGATHDDPTEMETDEEEPLAFFKRTPRNEPDLDITPMIDITFLLLIFFLVASKMSADAQVELPPAKKGDMVAQKKSVVITMVSSGNKTSTVFLGDNTNRPVRGGPQQQEDAVAKFLEDSFRADGRKTNVIIKAGKGVTNGDVARIQTAIKRAQVVDKIHLAVLDVQ